MNHGADESCSACLHYIAQLDTILDQNRPYLCPLANIRCFMVGGKFLSEASSEYDVSVAITWDLQAPQLLPHPRDNYDYRYLLAEFVQHCLDWTNPCCSTMVHLPADKIETNLDLRRWGILDAITKKMSDEHLNHEYCHLEAELLGISVGELKYPQNAPEQMGWLLVVLPTAFTGGDITIVVQDKGEMEAKNGGITNWLAFTCDCDIRADEIKEGECLILVYKLLYCNSCGYNDRSKPESPPSC